MNFEVLPIEQFVSQMMGHPRISAVIGEWRVEPAEMVKVVSAYFRDIGFFYANAFNQSRILNLMIQFLRASPEIASMIRRAEINELERNKKTFVS